LTHLDLAPSTIQDFSFPLSGLAVRFVNGLNFTVSGSTLTGDWAVVNLYYSVP
jgi:hypothetical protein